MTLENKESMETTEDGEETLDRKAKLVERGLDARILPSAEAVVASQAEEISKLENEGTSSGQSKKSQCNYSVFILADD